MRREILVVFPHHASFIDQDLRILRSRFDVEEFPYERPSDRYRLAARVSKSQVTISWFVLGYSYLISRLRRLTMTRSILIPGGWDVESMPEFNYGEMRSRRAHRRTSYCLSHADLVLPVSQFTMDRVRAWAPDAPVELLHHGFDPEIFVPGERRRQGVVTVSHISRGTWHLKGLSHFVEAARHMPEVPFTIVGDVSEGSELLRGLPENLHLLGALPHRDLARVYQQARVYAQLSAVEAFGCSVAEAMLCGCLPVVTDRGALPEVVGGVGERVSYGDIDGTVGALGRALAAPDQTATPRERISELFPLEKRATRLLGILERFLGGT